MDFMIIFEKDQDLEFEFDVHVIVAAIENVAQVIDLKDQIKITSKKIEKECSFDDSLQNGIFHLITFLWTDFRIILCDYYRLTFFGKWKVKGCPDFVDVSFEFAFSFDRLWK